MRICDKCVYCDQVCPTPKEEVMTKDDVIVACNNYKLNPAFQLERDITQALQELVRRGRIRRGWITRSSMQIMSHTDPVIPSEEIFKLMKHGGEITRKDDKRR